MSAAAPLPAVVVEPEAPADAAVIWLHGLGADGHDFEALVPALDLPPEAAIRFVFPHAPYRHVTINGGALMRAWYDILELGTLRREDEAGIRDSEQALVRLIGHERDRGIAPGRIVLAGFSQGGAMALHTGLRYPDPLAGILALSAYLPLAEHLAREAHPANRDTPILMAHGHNDPVIPVALAERARGHLVRLGYRVEWHSYPMGHTICPEEVTSLSRWLRQRLIHSPAS